MNTEKFTQKTAEAVRAAQSVSVEHGNAEIAPEHLCYALIAQEDGLIGSILKKKGVDVTALLSDVESLINKLPSVSGRGADPDKIYVSSSVERTLNTAERLAAGLKDEYVSVEHVMLALFDNAPDSLKDVLRARGVTKESFTEELKKVKTSRVTSDNPESSYDALSKYGFDLVERAKNGQTRPRYRS